MATPISNAIQILIAQIKGDIEADIKPIIVNLANAIKANSDPINVANQIALAQAAILLSAPTLEKQVIGQAADALLAFANGIPNPPAA